MMRWNGSSFDPKPDFNILRRGTLACGSGPHDMKLPDWRRDWSVEHNND